MHSLIHTVQPIACVWECACVWERVRLQIGCTRRADRVAQRHKQNTFKTYAKGGSFIWRLFLETFDLVPGVVPPYLRSAVLEDRSSHPPDERPPGCFILPSNCLGQSHPPDERWGAGVETQKNVRGEIGGWGRVPFNEPYAPSLSTIYDGA